MKKIVVGLAAALATAAFWATPALADQPPDLQCPAGGESVNPPGGTTAGGVVVTISGASVTFSEEVSFCVKASNENSGILVGTSFTVNWDADGNPNNGVQIPNVSHVVVYGTTGGTDTGGTDTTTGGTDTTTGGTDTTTGGTDTTTGGTTTTTTGGVSGGTTGGTTGGTAATPTGGNLPFTGLPVWVPLLAAAAMFASGIFLVRRRRGEVS
jgi:hypothetical protein